MNFSTEEINKWYETEAGKINGNLVTCSVNKIIKDKLNSDILYIGPSNIVKEIMHDNLSFRSFYISSSSNCDIKAEIQKLPLKESSVDCVVLIHSLETNKNPHAAFREIDRVLTEDGEIILVSFNKMSFIGLINIFRIDTIFKNKSYISISRLEDWAKLFSYEIYKILNINKIPPFKNEKILKYLSFLNNSIFSKANFFGNTYIMYIKKKTYKFISLKNWHKKNNIVLGKFSKPVIHNNYEK